MLKVVSHVNVWDVPPADIIVSLLSFDELIVFGYDVDCCWMRADWAEAWYKNKDDGVGSPEVIYEIVYDYDKDVVDTFI